MQFDVRAVTLLCARVHAAVREVLVPVIAGAVASLRALGCEHKTDQNMRRFMTEARTVLRAFAHEPLPAELLHRLRLPDTVTTRNELLVAFARSLGSGPERAQELAAFLLSTAPEDWVPFEDFVRPSGPLSPSAEPQMLVTRQLYRLWTSGCDVHRRLVGIQARVSEPYRLQVRSTTDPLVQFGMATNTPRTLSLFAAEPVGELMSLVPELVGAIYHKLGWTALSGWPPAANGTASEDEALFAELMGEYFDERATREALEIVVLIAAGLVLSVVSLGVLGATGATLAGVGNSVVEGGLRLHGAQEALADARALRSAGIASDERIEYLEGEVQGAWGAIVADVVTAGASSKVPAGRTWSVWATMGLEGAGSALGAATDPNVWRSENTLGILLEAAVIGAAGDAATGQAGRYLVGLRRGAGPLATGSHVRIAGQGDMAPTAGTVASTGAGSGRLSITTSDGVLALQVLRAGLVVR